MNSDNPPRKYPKMLPEVRLWIRLVLTRRRLVPEIKTILQKSIVIESRNRNSPQTLWSSDDGKENILDPYGHPYGWPWIGSRKTTKARRNKTRDNAINAF